MGAQLEVARFVLLSLEATRLDELGAEKIKGIFAEVRQVGAGLGLGPKGMQDRRWRIAPPEVVDQQSPPAGAGATVTQMDTYRSMLAQEPQQ